MNLSLIVVFTSLIFQADWGHGATPKVADSGAPDRSQPAGVSSGSPKAADTRPAGGPHGTATVHPHGASATDGQQGASPAPKKSRKA